MESPTEKVLGTLRVQTGASLTATHEVTLVLTGLTLHLIAMPGGNPEAIVDLSTATVTRPNDSNGQKLVIEPPQGRRFYFPIDKISNSDMKIVNAVFHLSQVKRPSPAAASGRSGATPRSSSTPRSTATAPPKPPVDQRVTRGAAKRQIDMAKQTTTGAGERKATATTAKAPKPTPPPTAVPSSRMRSDTAAARPLFASPPQLAPPDLAGKNRLADVGGPKLRNPPSPFSPPQPALPPPGTTESALPRTPQRTFTQGVSVPQLRTPASVPSPSPAAAVEVQLQHVPVPPSEWSELTSLDVKSLQIEIEALKKENAMLTTSVESLRSELGNSQRVASASTSKHIEVMETAMKEVTRLGQENDGLQASVAVFQRRARELEDQVDQLQSKLSATTEALQKYPKPSDVDDLRGQLQGAVAKNAGLAKVIEEREQRIEGLVQANSRLDALKASAEAEIAAVRSRNELLGDANSELMRRIEAMEPSRGSVPEAESSDSPIVEALQSQVKELERLLNEERMRNAVPESPLVQLPTNVEHGNGKGPHLVTIVPEPSAPPPPPKPYDFRPQFEAIQTLQASGAFPQAEQAYIQLLSDVQSAEGVISLGSGTVHTLLGQVQAAQEKFGPAEAQFQAAVNIFSEVCGFVHPHTAQSLGQLSAIQAELGHYEEALGSAKRAVESLRSGVGGKDVATASALFNVGGLAKRLNRVPEAEAAFEEALAIFKLKQEHSRETGDTAYQLGLLNRKRNPSKAGGYFSFARGVYEAIGGAGDEQALQCEKHVRQLMPQTRPPALP